ncbi:MAG: NUDIX domain-containing protein [Candidatus Korobacteraceae bacterium]|jgi:8-oxo-dGTP pyrophosphatase MutT (NUDIX family)
MEREFSAGGVVLRKMRGRWFLAVIEPHMERPKKVPLKSSRQSKKGPPAIIALPKGAIDHGEKPEQTALREVEEETGLRAELVSKLADIKYVYLRNWGDQARVFKIVSFYLLLYRSGRLGTISPEMRVEVRRAFWIPLDKAAALLSYKGEREVAGKAQHYVAAHPDIAAPAADASG